MELYTLLAILLGPILAVQVQARLDIRRERRARKDHIFRVLMATRQSQLSQDHVLGLNSIDVVFYGKSRKDKLVIDAWNIYHDHLNRNDLDPSIWVDKKNELFLNLLDSLAKCLGYSFDRTRLRTSSYYPIGHGDIENENKMIRKGIVDIVSGEKPLVVNIK